MVLDASAAVHLVMTADHAASLADHLEKAVSVAVPDLFYSEVGNSLWKYVKSGNLTIEQAMTHLEEAMGLVDSVTPSDSLVHEAIVAAARYSHPVYDMIYAVMARRHGAAVLTMDRDFAILLRRMEIDLYCPIEKTP